MDTTTIENDLLREQVNVANTWAELWQIEKPICDHVYHDELQSLLAIRIKLIEIVVSLREKRGYNASSIR